MSKTFKFTNKQSAKQLEVENETKHIVSRLRYISSKRSTYHDFNLGYRTRLHIISRKINGDMVFRKRRSSIALVGNVRLRIITIRLIQRGIISIGSRRQLSRRNTNNKQRIKHTLFQIVYPLTQQKVKNEFKPQKEGLYQLNGDPRGQGLNLVHHRRRSCNHRETQRNPC